mmetsp:Transcript_5410/g.16070  ORF Transcript_5410/g.16070 Transcript_5410/m.16070 type:complete len:288 (+) Transcript_5410:876-1739(+)
MREHLQGRGVDAFLVDDHEGPLVLLGADLLLECDNLPDLLVRELALGLHQLVALLRRAVEEAGVHLALLVLQGDVARQDVALLQPLGHVGVPCAVIQDQAPDEARVGGELVLHVQDLHHVQVQRLPRLLDAPHGVHGDLRHGVGDRGGDLRAQRSPRQADQALAVVEDVLYGHLEAVQEFQGLLSREIKTLGDEARMEALREAGFSELHQFTDEHHSGGSAVPSDVVLGGRRACDHAGRGVLDLHLPEQHVAVLGDLDLARAAHEHLQGTPRAQVALHDLLQAFRGI